ncbi:MAG TPA: hypothetical protein VF669_06340 [Tepidisphaeraceae bacterium]|jgi:hypothetical protein
MDVLARIKQCALLHQVRFTLKPSEERFADELSELEILESLVNATRIEKTIRSTAPRGKRREYLYVIKSPTAAGELVYTKGKLVNEQGLLVYYLLISAKLSNDS